jgi:hypothetical protein
MNIERPAEDSQGQALRVDLVGAVRYATAQLFDAYLACDFFDAGLRWSCDGCPVRSWVLG